MNRWIIFVGFVFTTLSTASADELDDQINTLMKEQRVPGLSFAVVQNGRTVRLGAYGYGNLEWKTKTTNDTRFEIASISKMFAGAAVRILIEEGKLDTEDLVSKYIPGTPQAWAGMKVRHLITMSSGLPEDFGFETIPYGANVATEYDDASMLKSFFSLKMASTVGNEFHYSGPNYAMLGMIVAKASGRPFQEFVRECIFKPAGMTQTTYIDNSAIVPERADGYRMKDGKIVKGWFLGQYLHTRPDVGVLTTARDFAKWLIALESGKIVKHPDKLWEGGTSDTGHFLDYSYGWFIQPFLGHRRQTHSGGYRTGFHTFTSRYPDDGLSVVVFTNCDYSAARQFALTVSLHYLGPKVMNPMIESTKPDTDPKLTAALISAMKGVAAGKLDERMFTPDVLDGIGLADASEFLKPVEEWTYAGRSRVPPPGLRIHGHALLDFETLKLRVGSEYYFFTLYRDAQGKIAYVEDTT